MNVSQWHRYWEDEGIPNSSVDFSSQRLYSEVLEREGIELVIQWKIPSGKNSLHLNEKTSSQFMHGQNSQRTSQGAGNRIAEYWSPFTYLAVWLKVVMGSSHSIVKYLWLPFMWKVWSSEYVMVCLRTCLWEVNDQCICIYFFCNSV